MTRRRWAGIASLLVLVAVVAVAVVLRDDRDGDDSMPPELREAVATADLSDPPVTAEELADLIASVCRERDGARLGERVVELGVRTEAAVRELVEGVGRGAASLCPELAAEDPELVNEAYTAAIARLAEDGDQP